MTVALAAGLTGLAFGALSTRGGVCFNRGVRRAALEGDRSILRIFALIVAFELVLLPLLFVFGVEPLERNVDAGSPALLPVAQLVGGLVFGIGMALAGGCITGILWKTGAGSLATAVAIAGFVVGELLATGAGARLLAELDDVAAPGEGSLAQISGLPFEVLAPIVGATALTFLLARDRRGLWLGACLGGVAALAWVAADLAGYGYGLGFVGAASGTRAAIESGGELPFQLFLAAGVVAGAALVARRRLRRPPLGRAAIALGGGVLMGVGANMAHGCNIGHGVTGLGLLSLGSLLTVGAMVAGALVTAKALRRA
jgi:uncharacterized protein